MKKSIVLICLTISVLFFSCKSTKNNQIDDNGKSNQIEETEEKITISKHPDAMFWEINGFSEDGEASKVYVLGTYHLADERSYPIPSDIYQAWNDSERFVCELSSEDWSNYQTALNKKVNESVIVGTDKSLIDELTQDELTTIVDMLGEEQTAAAFCYEPWVLLSLLSDSLMQSTGLIFKESYDSVFMNLAKNQNKTLEGLDDLQTQVDLNTYGDWNTQISFMHDELSSFKNKDEALTEINDFYNAYLSHDEKIFEEIYFDDVEKSVEENSLYESYIQRLLYDRNKLWADKFADYLNQGGTTFVFAGCAHFTGKKSVFDFLLQK